MQHERGLPGTVRAEQGDPLALVDVQVHTEERLCPVGVGVRQSLDVEHRDGHQETSAVSCRGVFDATSGRVPSYPRASMARCTRSPRS